MGMIPDMTTLRPRRLLPAATLLALSTTLAACTSASEPAEPSGARADSSGAPSNSADAAADGGEAPATVEQRAATPRLVATYDGGLLVLDSGTLETVADIPLDGFARVNPAGDGRHVAVSTEGGFRLLDAGTWTEPHGDHSHHYTSAPTLTDAGVDAGTPGHVVVHDGKTAFFDDGSGLATVVASDSVADEVAQRRALESESPHHGVAVAFDDGEVVSTLGDPDSRTGAIARDASGEETARTEQCPGVHGEAAARDAIVLGCTDGALIYSGGDFTKVDAPDDYGRLGNLSGSPASEVVLGDYKVDEEAELERPTRVSLVDTEQATLRLVDLPASYSFRSLGRGPDGEALVLGTDGALHVIDPGTGELTRSLDVVEPWTEPTDWKEPRPTLYVQDGSAYVSDPANARLVAVDLDTLTVGAETTLPHATDEVTGVSGGASGDGTRGGGH